jgi:predicted glycoside hydrolase/deacetylase ChbG (UPF0249 family)
MKRLIVNADDLGYSDGVNRGIFEAHERGIVTSASLMVDGPASAEAAELARAAPRLSVGLHAVLDRRGKLLVPPAECERELERQLDRFEELVGRRPTHVDSHHFVHRRRELAPAFAAFAERHALPLRDVTVRHCGLFYGRWGGASHTEQVGVESLLAILAQLEEGDTELGCHPGYADGLRSSYTAERERELATLTSPVVVRAVAELGIELIRWEDM